MKDKLSRNKVYTSGICSLKMANSLLCDNLIHSVFSGVKKIACRSPRLACMKCE